MGELKNCPVCGKVFVKMVRNLCPACIEEEEREFALVREYIKDSPGASVDEITAVTGVEENKIFKWLREGRIDYTSHERPLAINCKSCGAPIKIGNLCSECAKELSSKLNSMSHDKKTSTASQEREEMVRRMFVANRLRKDD